MARLINNDPRISDAVNNMGPYHALRGRVNGSRYSPDEQLMPYLEQAGFRSATLIQMFDLRYDLISVLVKRWRPETHTFRLLCGECTVTLEDVALQLGLLIDGSPITGISAIAEPAALCYSLLGASPGDNESNFLGVVLMPDANNNRVYLQYLHLLADLSNDRFYSCGFAVLAMLYHELCRTTKHDAIEIGGCLILLQSWALYQMPYINGYY
ncbi:hypothetical protein J1N35_019529 [Gossypium stocksii]|uniref:Aminotransferase-like plant mobile domain-containing protein n=1 Tax=Gossypium stocksii TaxID=47602 RepID=A0A9D4A5Z6_9ROSI|nr:hypothetical protein J1N35_019529 [Gossypium stocksii]